MLWYRSLPTDNGSISAHVPRMSESLAVHLARLIWKMEDADLIVAP